MQLKPVNVEVFVDVVVEVVDVVVVVDVVFVVVSVAVLGKVSVDIVAILARAKIMYFHDCKSIIKYF